MKISYRKQLAVVDKIFVLASELTGWTLNVMTEKEAVSKHET